MTQFFIFQQQSLYYYLISLHFYNYLESSLFSRHLVFSYCFSRFMGDLQSSFFVYQSQTFSRALSALNLLIYNSSIDFYLVIAVFSSLFFLFTLSIYQSLCRHSLDTQVILFCSYCSQMTIFCYLLASQAIFAFSLVSSKFKLAYIFLKCFYFYTSPFFCCYDKLVQNYIYFCFNVIRVLAYYAFFQVYNYQTTLYYSQFSYSRCQLLPQYFILTFSDGRWGYSTMFYMFYYIKSRISKPFCFNSYTGPKSYKYIKTRIAPTFFTGFYSSSTQSTGIYASNTLAKLSCFFRKGTVSTCFNSTLPIPNITSFFNRSLCHNSIFNSSLSLPYTQPAPASKQPEAKQLALRLNSARGLVTDIVGLLLKALIPNAEMLLYFIYSWAVNSWSFIERMSMERRSW